MLALTNRTTDETGIGRLQIPALGAGVVGLAISAFLAVSQPHEFARVWLPSFIFWFQIAAGCLGLMMLNFVTGGEWGIVTRRPLAAAARTMWLFFLLILPLWLGFDSAYVWAGEEMLHDPKLQVKQAWLNPPRFWAMSLGYIAVLTILAFLVTRASARFEATRDPRIDLGRRKLSAAGILILVLVLTFASIDWMMSLEPHWTSTMYGINFTVACGLSALAFLTLLMTRFIASPAYADVLKPKHFRDLGNLMLAFVMLYAYTAFSEFLLTWYANLKEEIPHFLPREQGGWGVIALAIVLFHFFLPFFMLLMRTIKDRPSTIAIVTVVVLLMRYIANYWLMGPAWYGGNFQFPLWNIATFVGIGGVWLFLFIINLKGQRVIPVQETWVEEAYREGALKSHA
jgi:hypothetical protein